MNDLMNEEEVKILFIEAEHTLLKIAADFAIPVSTIPLVNKMFDYILAGALKLMPHPLGNYGKVELEPSAAAHRRDGGIRAAG